MARSATWAIFRRRRKLPCATRGTFWRIERRQRWAVLPCMQVLTTAPALPHRYVLADRAAPEVAVTRVAAPQPLTADEARAAAAAEGLELVPSRPRHGQTATTGFKGVYIHHGRYAAMVREKGKLCSLGHFATPEEAALTYARHTLGTEEEAPMEKSRVAELMAKTSVAELTAVQVLAMADKSLAAAAAEGLELVPSSNETGFKCVAKNKAKYEAVTRENGKTHRLGTFVTPEEAALCYARYIGAERAAAEAAEARGEGPQLLTVDEARAAAAAALAAAAAEGLELVPSSRSNETGFKGVRRQRSGKYTAEVWENGKQNHLGSFTTPEKAALCIARYIGAERAAAEAAMVRAGKARAAAAAEGLEPPRSATGFEDTHETGEGMHEAKVKENGKLRYSAGTTYIPLTFHLPSTYLPLTFHLPSTYGRYHLPSGRTALRWSTRRGTVWDCGR